MPYDSNGVWSLTPGYLGVTGQPILPSNHNPPLEDISANGLSAVLVKDGRAPMAGNLNMGTTNKIINLAAGSSPGDAVNFSQLSNVPLTGAQNQGMISGLTLSNNATDAANDIDIAVGSAAADVSPFNVMTLASALTKRLDAAWAVGNNQGGLDTGAVGNNVYYVWLIQRSDTGVVDALFSLSNTAPTMPTNYDRKRVIGSFQRVSGVNQAPRSYALKEATDWIAYTPTITGFGTPSTVAFYSRRVGDTIEVKGSFVSGTSTAVEARVSLGFNGTNANIISEGSSKIPVQAIAGVVAQNAATPSSFVMLVERSVGYFTFGVQSSGAGATTKQNGATVAASGTLVTFFASVPIAGW